MQKLPVDFEAFTAHLVQEAKMIEGYLTEREMRFLALLAAVPTASGEILEIGSFKGKSTVILAKAAALGDRAPVNAVDPMTAPSVTDPDLRGAASSFADFQRNLERHGVAGRVNFHQTFSFELAKNWQKPLRLLWIDGDHTHRGTKLDFDGFAPFLQDGAIVAIHDVLHEFDGGIRVFMEDILLSPSFGACGLCGSIAWAQFHQDETKGRAHRRTKLDLYKKMSRLIPFVALRERLNGFEKKKYKLFRSRVPHAAVDPREWIKMVS